MFKSMIAAAAMGMLMAGSAFAGSNDEGLAAYNRGDFATAFKIMRPLAEQGDAVAMYTLGAMFENGLGVRQDPVEAVRWYRAALDGVPPRPVDAALVMGKGLASKN